MIDLHNILSDIRPFDDFQAVIAGRLETATRSAGLSLGDRACLALAQSLEVGVMTADRVWMKKKDTGVSVIHPGAGGIISPGFRVSSSHSVKLCNGGRVKPA